MNEDAAEGMTEEEGKKCTPPNKTPKKKKLKKDEDINEEEDDDKTESADTEMESQKDVNTNQDKPSKGHKHGDDPMENRGETEESKTDSDKDEVGSQLTEMETEAAVCQNKDPNLDSKELSKGGSKPEHELMEDQGKYIDEDSLAFLSECMLERQYECDGFYLTEPLNTKYMCAVCVFKRGIAVSADAKPPVEKIENSETEEGLVEMNTQVEDSLETEATQPENNQSKDVAGDVKDP
ncbi:hypothetical protein EOD39_6203 [Acipenser ruthenus]|uniref:Uncharacterized protein n=1 Tax=Acipenser ruthenus TaxID=7906 RepID=A0A444UB10_ACIRT|nr:hypothetical protein EOD39_6203 [Acipenser ruthenus]